jgi:hypothetical protein
MVGYQYPDLAVGTRTSDYGLRHHIHGTHRLNLLSTLFWGPIGAPLSPIAKATS